VLQDEIVQTKKEFIVQLIDVKQRQKVCLMPVDLDGNLPKSKPKDWKDIENGKFMIINGQHSIQASKELQEKGYCKDKRVKLQRWDAYIAWMLDAAKLRTISKFYNMTNHLDHAEPT